MVPEFRERERGERGRERERERDDVITDFLIIACRMTNLNLLYLGKSLINLTYYIIND